MINWAEVLCIAVMSMGFPRAELACQHMNYITEAADKYDISPELLIAVIHVESRWNPNVVSKSNACGLTQVLPQYTKPRISCKKLKNPRTSIFIGAKKLNFWIYKYAKGEKRVGLCGYNAGFRCKGKKKNKIGYYRYAPKVLKYEKALINEVDDILSEMGEQEFEQCEIDYFNGEIK
jgi:soluble lytic murein transglycosylase-like protein